MRYRSASEEEIRLLCEQATGSQELTSGSIALSRGDPMNELLICESGWLLRSRYTRSGRRQIINFLMPGDIVNPEVLAINQSDHEISALTDCTVVRMRRHKLHELALANAGLSLAMWWSSAQEEGILREHIVRLGRRAAIDRIAHMLLELQRRLSLVDDVGDSFRLPLTQVHIADALGLSPVHVNRAMRRLKLENAIDYGRSFISITDRSELAERVDFSTEHLHLDALDL